MPGVWVCLGGWAHLGTGGVAGILLALHGRILGVHRQAGARVAGNDRREGRTDLQWMGGWGQGSDIEGTGLGTRARTPPYGWEKLRPTEGGFFLLHMELWLCPLAGHRPGERQDPE